MVVGYSFDKTNSLTLVFGNLCQIAKSVITFVGWSALFYFVIHYTFKFVNSSKAEEDKSGNKIISFLFDRKPFLIPWGVIFVCWLPYAISHYPGALQWDSVYQIEQFFGAIQLSTHHPILSTWILGLFVLLGRVFGSDNIGCFILAMLQVIAFSAILALTLFYSGKLRISYLIRLIILGVYLFVPFFYATGVYIGKDTNYSFMLLLFTVFIAEIIRNPKKIFSKPLAAISFFAVALLTVFLRNNGIFAVLPALIVLMLVRRDYIKQISLIIVCILITFVGFNKLLLPKLNIPEGSAAEALSIPFQQSARYAKYYADETPASEKNAINKVLDYEKIRAEYNPLLSDSVKHTYKEGSTVKQRIDYVNIWLKQLKRHPLVYFEAMTNNSYIYFCPSSRRYHQRLVFSSVVAKKTVLDYVHIDISKGQSNIYRPSKLSKLNRFYDSTIRVERNTPIFCVFCGLGFWTWIVILCLFSFIQNKKYKYIAVMTPAVISILICAASPVNGETRYALPYIFAVPFLVMLCFYAAREES